MDEIAAVYVRCHGGRTVAEWVQEEMRSVRIRLAETRSAQCCAFVGPQKPEADYWKNRLQLLAQSAFETSLISAVVAIRQRHKLEEDGSAATPQYIYAMRCRDMPHLIKIGITNVPHHRLKTANGHDTYKPPSGYEYMQLVRVANSLYWENVMKDRFRNQRRKNANGNWTEFFEIDRVHMEDAFSVIEGKRMDVGEFDKGAEREEMRRLRRSLAKANAARTPCRYILPNPKTAGSKSYARYEKYSAAITVDQIVPLGGKWEDVVYDYCAGFLSLAFNAGDELKKF